MANKKPLLVNISGSRYVGVTCACGRIERCLNAMGIRTEVISLDSKRAVGAFKLELLLKGYDGIDVILFDKHFYTETAARRGLNVALWVDEYGMPDISVLMSPATSINDHHKTYLTMSAAHYGTSNHHVISTTGTDGALFAAGNIKALILKELRRA